MRNMQEEVGRRREESPRRVYETRRKYEKEREDKGSNKKRVEAGTEASSGLQFRVRFNYNARDRSFSDLFQ